MSVDGITLNSRVYNMRSVNGSKLMRAVTAATLPSGWGDTLLEISHTLSKTDKVPNRTLVKFSSLYESAAVPGLILPWSVHAVISTPYQSSVAEKQAIMKGDGGSFIMEDFIDLLQSAGTAQRLAVGEFS